MNIAQFYNPFLSWISNLRPKVMNYTSVFPKWLPWNTNQQLLTIVEPLTYNSRRLLTTYARTSSGRMVTSPKISYTVSNSLVALRVVSNDTVELIMPSTALPDLFISVTGTWTTSSGVLSSTIKLPVKF